MQKIDPKKYSLEFLFYLFIFELISTFWPLQGPLKILDIWIEGLVINLAPPPLHTHTQQLRRLIVDICGSMVILKGPFKGQFVERKKNAHLNF